MSTFFGSALGGLLGVGVAPNTAQTQEMWYSTTAVPAQQLQQLTGAGTISNYPSFQQFPPFPQTQPLPTFKSITEETLKHEAFNTPVETLSDLWLARFGDGWVDKTTVLGDDFFEIAAQRLLKLGRMEEYSFFSAGFKTVLRVM